MKKNISVTNIIIFLLIFSPCYNMMCEMIGIGYSFIYYLFVSILLMIVNLNKLSIAKISLLLFLLVVSVITIIKFGFGYIINQDFYGYFLTIIVLLFSIKNNEVKRFFETKSKYFFVSLILYLVLLFISVVFMNGFREFSAYSSYKVLFGPYSISHILAYELLLYIICSYVLIRNKILRIIILLFLLLLLLITQVRTAILALAFLCLIESIITNRLSKKNKIILIITECCVVLFTITLYFTNSLSSIPLFSKTVDSISNGSISNGREDFINIAINHFKDFSLEEKLNGISVTEIRNIYKKEINNPIHCHNDIFTILLGFGYSGLVLFICSFFFFIQDAKKIPFSVFVFIFIWFNGLYMYYSFVFLLILIKSLYFSDGLSFTMLGDYANENNICQQII